ncbi:hypothetical protein F5890DRAFT_1401877, partial [Lentinula detonsa]
AFDACFTHSVSRAQTSTNIIPYLMPLLSAEEYARAASSFNPPEFKYTSFLFWRYSHFNKSSTYLSFRKAFCGYGSKRTTLNDFAISSTSETSLLWTEGSSRLR